MNVLQTVSRTELLAAFAIALVAAAIGFSASSTSTADESEVLTWHNEITVMKNGEHVATFHNALPAQGQNWIRDQIGNFDQTGGGELTNTSYISLGNGTEPTNGGTTTQLDQEIVDAASGLTRAAGSFKVFGDGEFHVKNQFDATANVGVVNTTGLNWNSSGPSLISGGAFGASANIQDGDTLTVVHNITIS